MLTEKNFDADRVSIHYAEGPASGQPLVLLHGGTLRWQDFLPVLPQFSFRYHTFALDLRGHGQSGHTPGAYRIDQYADDIEQFLRVQVTEPAVLLGYSLGSHVAIDVAARVPELLLALVLAEPVPYPSSETDPDSPFMQRWRAIRELVKMGLSQKEMSTKLAQILAYRDDASLRSRAKDFLQLDPDVLTYIIEEPIDLNFHPDELLSKITCPVLLLQGDPTKGNLTADEHVARIQSHLADCTHVRLPDAGHNLHTPQPDNFYQIVTRFLESL